MMPHSVPPPPPPNSVMMYPVTGYTPKDVDVNLTYSNGNFNLNGVIEKRRLYIHQSGNIPAHMDRVTSYTPLNQINLIYNNGQSIGLDEALTSRHLYISSYCMQCSGKKCVRCETGGKSRRRRPHSRRRHPRSRSRHPRSRHSVSTKRRRRRN
jgi:hypothetical protein